VSPFGIQLTKGFKVEDLEQEDRDSFQKLQKLGAIEQGDGVWKLKSLYRVGELYMDSSGRGFIEAPKKELKDLLVESNNLLDANRGDVVVVKRIIARRGRASAKVVLVVKRAKLIDILYISEDGKPLNIKTALPTPIGTNSFEIGTVLKVDSLTNEIIEIIGNIDNPKVDEKISLALHNRLDEFEEESIAQARNVPNVVQASEHHGRVDLRGLHFCTIDPVTAKDFDDAIYFDVESFTLYVAIADVSFYVNYFSPIDREAKRRGFTTYFPHKSFPMLPRELSENICSLKPHQDRLAFVAKIVLDRGSLNPIHEEFFEAVIHSRRRFNYDEVDRIIESGKVNVAELEYLIPLQKVTQSLRERRLQSGFDFRSEEVKLTIDSDHNLINTQIETGTPSHSLIEECMLLANRASAKRFEYGIFRVHLPPQLHKLEELLGNLATIGLFVEEYEDAPSLIRAIQTEAEAMGIASEVDEMIIKSLQQATYSPENYGHFGLGFTHYSHFTSPIRRYSDLILHRLIKAQLKDDREEMEYLLRNIEPLSARVSQLERESAKAEWDFRDRKLARWADKKIGEQFSAHIIEITNNGAKAILDSEIKGVVVNINNIKDKNLFDKVVVEIDEVNIPLASIYGRLVQQDSLDIIP